MSDRWALNMPSSDNTRSFRSRTILLRRPLRLLTLLLLILLIPWYVGIRISHINGLSDQSELASFPFSSSQAAILGHDGVSWAANWFINVYLFRTEIQSMHHVMLRPSHSSNEMRWVGVNRLINLDEILVNTYARQSNDNNLHLSIFYQILFFYQTFIKYKYS